VEAGGEARDHLVSNRRGQVGRLELAAPARDDRDDRHAEGPADLLGGRQHAGGLAGVAAADADEDHVEQRRDRAAEPESAYHQSGQALPGMNAFAVAADRLAAL
jgi:hypothetical protein